ncbi:exported protein of unknown function [Azospirillum baldaniorum]|uniref:Uncharacterized protein n=1 Tax=Azospirillum baldaniorum TaxID=1064539 RepID=A0A9P1JMW2_9PROT|nr:exported protein of unknown function [Azospirillum baldaniorum]
MTSRLASAGAPSSPSSRRTAPPPSTEPLPASPVVARTEAVLAWSFVKLTIGFFTRAEGGGARAPRAVFHMTDSKKNEKY